MLYGVRRDLQEQLVREGYRMRVYVPFGTQWYPYLMRRLAERPANVAFITGNVMQRDACAEALTVARMPAASSPRSLAGDANTIGGYAAVHARPAAFEGTDGMSYSVEIVVDETEIAGRPYGAYLLFVRWRASARRASRATSRRTISPMAPRRTRRARASAR